MTFDDFDAKPETVDARRFELFTQCRAEALSSASLSGIIQSGADLYPEMRGSSIEDAIGTMRRNVDISLDQPTAFTIRFRYDDREKARRAAQGLVTAMIAASTRWSRGTWLPTPSADTELSRSIELLEARTAAIEAKAGIPLEPANHSNESGNRQRLSMELLDAPTAPVNPDFDWHKTLTIAGGCAGLGFGVYLRRRRKNAHVL